jgi:hypothetical protein
MKWTFIRIIVLALFLIMMPLVQAQDVSVGIRAWSYIFPDGDACVQLEWEANGLRGHELQLVMRGIDIFGDLLPNGVGLRSEFADRSGLLTSRLDVSVPFDETEWTDTYICLPAVQFPAGEYDWYPMITIVDRTYGGVLLLAQLGESIRFGQFDGSPGQLIAPQTTPEASP